MRVLILLPEGS